MQIEMKWIRCFRPRPNAKLRLVCLPFAGGGASTYRPWVDAFPSSVEVWAIQPPGREDRFSEPPFTSRLELVRALADALAPRLDERYCLFGHSMGARLALDLTRELRTRGALGPEHLFVSARAAPHLPPRRRALHDLPRPELIDAVRELNGTPEEVFDEPELLELVLPLLRADFTVNEKEPHVEERPLACPITAFGGTHDPHAPEDQVAAWRDYTTGAFRQITLKGDHFYLVNDRRTFLEQLVELVVAHAP
jgi:surfactin synthase thioesterase subunit